MKKSVILVAFISITLTISSMSIIHPWLIKTYGPTDPIPWGIVGTGYFESTNFDLVDSENKRYKKFCFNVTNFQCYASISITHIDNNKLENPEIWTAHVTPTTKLYTINEDGSKNTCSIEDFKNGDLVSIEIGESGIDGNLILSIIEMTLNQNRFR